MIKETAQDIKEEAKTQPHPKISAFLKEYKNNREKVVEKEIKKRKELAISLFRSLNDFCKLKRR